MNMFDIWNVLLCRILFDAAVLDLNHDFILTEIVIHIMSPNSYLIIFEDHEKE